MNTASIGLLRVEINFSHWLIIEEKFPLQDCCVYEKVFEALSVSISIVELQFAFMRTNQNLFRQTTKQNEAKISLANK